MHFDLHRLGWYDFQQLCLVAAREILGQNVREFLPSHDAGRDGAFTGTWLQQDGSALSGNFVIQCKHTSRATHNLGPADLAPEISKVRNLVRLGLCDVYILMTNAGLTASSEAEVTRQLHSAGVGHVVVFGRTWIESTIQTSAKLRMLVPRIYGLGDLTQILDERAYNQAQAVLQSMRTDLAKIIHTGTYDAAASALHAHGFVLLLGRPATGKTTIAAELCLAAPDIFGAQIVKLDSIAEISHLWNPNESQLFWLDDAFGSTSINRGLARDWARYAPKVWAAIDSNSRFILTSRDYIYEAARPDLKPGAYPLLHESTVVVDVRQLNAIERRQILYAHLKHGKQSPEAVRKIRPHLEYLADHVGFSPELCRRLADPTFTDGVDLSDADQVSRFFAEPIGFLRDVLLGLDKHQKAALAVIFANGGFLPSPILLSDRDCDLIRRLDSRDQAIGVALGEMKDSLVVHTRMGEGTGWSFIHPTMADAFIDLLRSPELLAHLLTGSPLSTLLKQAQCGDVEVVGAIRVPNSLYSLLIDRMRQITLTFSSESDRQVYFAAEEFLATRCDDEFLLKFFSAVPEKLRDYDEVGRWVEFHDKNDVFVRLVQNNIVDDDARAAFAWQLVELTVTGTDAAILWKKPLMGLLTSEERSTLYRRLREEVIQDTDNTIDTIWCEFEDAADPDPEFYASYTRQLADALPSYARRMGLEVDDPDIPAAWSMLNDLASEFSSTWVDLQDRELDTWDEGEAGEWDEDNTIPFRSIFDDLLD